ncbi:MAG: glycosyl transferase family 2, partial [Solirubrobacterales bacterium]|nr:glycosyl transferase family 2 [Solirubrobacterales bacterium]
MPAPGLLVVVPFQNEAILLPVLLGSIAAQTLAPDRLVLVDDGSDDGSTQIAGSFAAEHGYAEVLTLPRRPPARDRLVRAHEWRAFEAGLAHAGGADRFAVLAKLDADLRLPPPTFAALTGAMEEDERLGLVGALLSIETPGGGLLREPCPPGHVRGATKFYRSACYAQIAPIPAVLGWDTLDEIAARHHGWTTRSIPVPGGDPVHLRPTGTHDGRLRAHHRGGMAAYGYGLGPLTAGATALARVRR